MSPWRRLGRKSPAIVWTLLVVAALGWPGEDLPQPEIFDWFDKLVHAVLFMVHLVLLARALERRLLVAVLGSALLAATMEAAQLWIPGRGWEWWDLFAGLLGIGVAALIRHRRRATLPPPLRGG